jgi:thiol:disulfide interchange protein DsbD
MRSSLFSLLIVLAGLVQPADCADPGGQPAASQIKLAPAQLKNVPFSDNRIEFQIGFSSREAKRGQIIKLVIKGILKPGFHTYPMTQRTADQDAGFLSTLKFADSTNFKPLYPIIESDPDEVLEDVGEVVPKAFLEHKRDFSWIQDILVLPEAQPGPQPLQFQIKLQVCDRQCVIGQPKFEEFITISDAPAIQLTGEITNRLQLKPEIKVLGSLPAPPSPPDTKRIFPATPNKIDSKPDREPGYKTSNEGTSSTIALITQSESDYKAGMEKIQKQIQGGADGTTPKGLLAFMLTGVFWGAVSLVTPCVFPMIPITVSFFLKQSEKAHYRPVTMAVVYCLTIVVVLTIAAYALLSFFQWLSTNPTMNIALGVLFLVFSLSLFGMYDLELPSGLARFTSSREGQGGLMGVVFMALTFTIVSFACVAPFLGGFGGTAESSGIGPAHRVFGGLAFAATFASPFFVLALFPALLKKLPKSGSWLNSVKVVMGFLELAAAVKFFRAGELVILPTPAFFSFDLSLGMYIALALLCGLYLLNVYRLPLDSPTENIGVPRMLFGFLFLSLSFYLAPAMFKFGADGEKQRPNGTIYSWIESFLLPEPRDGKGALEWSGNLVDAVEKARKYRQETGKAKLVFVDFTGKL